MGQKHYTLLLSPPLTLGCQPHYSLPARILLIVPSFSPVSSPSSFSFYFSFPSSALASFNSKHILIPFLCLSPPYNIAFTFNLHPLPSEDTNVSHPQNSSLTLIQPNSSQCSLCPCRRRLAADEERNQTTFRDVQTSHFEFWLWRQCCGKLDHYVQIV
jgi:hypothetical protein